MGWTLGLGSTWPGRYLRGASATRGCALALLEATAPLREADFSDRVALLKLASERLQVLQLIEAVLASPHVIEDAPSLASVGALKAEAQDVFVNFASHMLAIAKLPKPRRRSRRFAANCQVM